MKIAILADQNNTPKARKQAEAIKQFGCSLPIVVFTSKSIERDVLDIFSGISGVTVKPTLQNIVRRPPMTSNEPFYHIAKEIGDADAWFYLSSDSIPLHSGWETDIEREYLRAGKPFMGIADYQPISYSSAGVNRVDHGAPYLLECAVYPADFWKNMRNRTPNYHVHHEQYARNERFPKAHITNLIFNANWKDTAIASGEAVATRVFNNAIAVAPEQECGCTNDCPDCDCNHPVVEAGFDAEYYLPKLDNQLEQTEKLPESTAETSETTDEPPVIQDIKALIAQAQKEAALPIGAKKDKVTKPRKPRGFHTSLR